GVRAEVAPARLRDRRGQRAFPRQRLGQSQRRPALGGRRDHVTPDVRLRSACPRSIGAPARSLSVAAARSALAHGPGVRLVNSIVRSHRDASRVVPQQPVPPERVVRFRARTVLVILGIVLAVAALLEVVWIARQVLSWFFVALFLALALNPIVEWLQKR